MLLAMSSLMGTLLISTVISLMRIIKDMVDGDGEDAEGHYDVDCVVAVGDYGEVKCGVDADEHVEHGVL